MKARSRSSMQLTLHRRPATTDAAVRLRSFVSYMLAPLLIAILSACANKSNLANHSFQFDARTDSPDTEILNWRYGDSKVHGTRPETHMLRAGRVPQQIGTSGEIRVGKDLYVKWRLKSTQEVFEQTVDLRDKLPSNIENHTIRFIVNQSQLYVYLITPTKLAPNPCPSNERRLPLRISGVPDERVFSLYCSHKIMRLHPINGIVPIFN